MVAAVDERDADRRSGKVTNGFEPAEPGADHDHMMGARLRWPRHRPAILDPRSPGDTGAANEARPGGGLRSMSCRRAVQATSGLAASRRARRRWRALRVAQFGSWPNNFEDISSKRRGSGSAHFDVANVATSQGKTLATRGARRVTPRLAHDVAIQLLRFLAWLIAQVFSVRHALMSAGACLNEVGAILRPLSANLIFAAEYPVRSALSAKRPCGVCLTTEA